MKKSTAGYVRLGVLLFALVNQGLVLIGFEHLPFSNEEFEAALTSTFTIVAAITAWWYNNPVTGKGKAKEGER